MVVGWGLWRGGGSRKELGLWEESQSHVRSRHEIAKKCGIMTVPTKMISR